MEGFDASLAEGVILLTPFNADSTDEKTAAFVAKYQELFGEIPNQFAADGYDVAYALVEAMGAAGVTADMSAEEINDALIETFKTFTFNGVTGENMTWENGAVNKDPKGMIIKDGAYVGLD
jgi:branched-chain amino acid transport system substrate-binding protein